MVTKQAGIEWLDRLRNWAGGGQFVNLLKQEAPKVQKFLRPAAEEVQQLKRQQLLSKWTGGLTERPFFHLQDRILGGIPGAYVGYKLDDKLRQHSGSVADKAGRVAATATGGWAGGKGLNELLNVGRKYVANTSPIFNYNASDVPKFSWQRLWNHGVRNLPLPATDLSSVAEDRRTPTGKIRAELLRRALGVHAPDAAKDYFVRRPDMSYGVNPATQQGDDWTAVFRQATNRFNQGQAVPFNEPGVDPKAFRHPPRYSNDSSNNFFRSVFGSHDTRYVPGTMQQTPEGLKAKYRLGDVWNFKVDPHEKPELQTYLKGLFQTSPQHWKDYLAQDASLGHLQAGTQAETVGGRLAQAGMRTTMDKVLQQHDPVIRQDLDVTFPHQPKFDADGTAVRATLDFPKAANDWCQTLVAHWQRTAVPS